MKARPRASVATGGGAAAGAAGAADGAGRTDGAVRVSGESWVAAAMPAFTAFAAGWHARPLLPYDREALRRYAGEHALRWIDDPSNADRGFDRNYLRHTVMPLLRERWPATARVLAASTGV